MVEKNVKSEILRELEDNYMKLSSLIGKQLFTVKDAENFLQRYYNVLRKVEQLTDSRDNWRKKYIDMKDKFTRLQSQKI